MFSQLFTLTTSVLCAEGSSSLLESAISQKRSRIFVVLSGGRIEDFSLTQNQKQQIDEALKIGYCLKVLAEEMNRKSFPWLTEYDSMPLNNLENEFGKCGEFYLSLEQKLREMARKQKESVAAGNDHVLFRDPETVKHLKEAQEKLQKLKAAIVLLKSESSDEFRELNRQLTAYIEQLAQIRFNDEKYANDENPHYVHCKNKLRGIILQ